MPTTPGEPSKQNQYLAEHVGRLLESLRRWTGRSLVEPDQAVPDQARALFYAPFVVLSHNTDAQPLLNYANRAGLKLFELTWEELIELPSRPTAEPIHQDERAYWRPSLARVLSMIIAAFGSPRAVAALSSSRRPCGICTTRMESLTARRQLSAVGDF